jgi:Protein of unknown function (DUF2510)
MFLIIWGFRNSAKTMAMLTMACRNGHVAAHRLTKVTRKFTLFFIPLFPVSHRYFSTCAACGLQVAWDKESAEAAALHAGEPQAGGGPQGIPAGTFDPVAPPVNSAAPPAGWYADPAGGQGMRYWNGSAWTESVHDG